jgi:hypothetical protein
MFRQHFGSKPGIIVATLLMLSTVGFAIFQICFRAPQPANAEPEGTPMRAGETGTPNDARAFPGYTLFASLRSNETFLIDMKGQVVNKWTSDGGAALGAYLLDNGHLLRPSGGVRDDPGVETAGAGGAVQEYTWSGELVWTYTWPVRTQTPHHDIRKLSSGNVLMIVSERKTAREVRAAGRKPGAKAEPYVLSDCIFEIKPTGKTSGMVVWEWHLWDHLIQDYDQSMGNYGNVAAHPELVDVNFGEGTLAPLGASKDEAIKKLRALGYVGSGASAKTLERDWTHMNSVAYNAELDQIILSVKNFNEIWVIDHGTTTAQAAGHGGGRYGRGGDLLYRWGNPQAYRAGTAEEQQLAEQHDAHWIARGLPGEGHVLVFNNGCVRPGEERPYSSVDEIVLPVDRAGRYALTPGKPYGPDKPVWSYYASDKPEFFSAIMSGAQRLPNGNTLICASTMKTILEVTPEREIVWKYEIPITARLAVADARQPSVNDPWFMVNGSAPADKPATVPPSFTILTAFAGTGDQKDVGRAPDPSPSGGTVFPVASVFRAYRYGRDYPGLAGKDLKPGKTVGQSMAAQAGEK